jgi:hypothetical protein
MQIQIKKSRWANPLSAQQVCVPSAACFEKCSIRMLQAIAAARLAVTAVLEGNMIDKYALSTACY